MVTVLEAAGRVLGALATFARNKNDPMRGRHALPGEALVKLTKLEPMAVSDAVEYLRNRKLADTTWGIGGPFSFTAVTITTEGRALHEAGQRQRTVNAKRVFVVHGRDRAARDAMFAFLRALGLTPIEWEDARRQTGTASPHNSEIVGAGLASAKAVVVLFTPDELVRLRPDLSEEPGDDRPGWQPRPNVVLEAGAAFQLYPRATIIVEVGKLRPVSDLAGRNTVRVTRGPEWRQKVTTRLADAQCALDRGGTDWLSAGDFDAVLSKAEAATKVPD